MYQIKFLFERIEEHGPTSNINILINYLKLIEKIVKKNLEENPDLFYSLVEGIVISIQSQGEKGDEEVLEGLVDQLISLLEENIENSDYLAAISDAIIQSLEILLYNDFLEILENYVNYLYNITFEHEENIILRTTSIDAIIIAITGFGGDWNFEKTQEFGEMLRTILPIKTTKGLLAGILIKGLAEEISCYGDMQEFSAMSNSLEDMKLVFSLNSEFLNDIIEDYTNGLVYAIKWFGEAEEFEKMIAILNELTELNKQSENNELKLIYANGLRTALDLSGVMEDLDAVTKFTKDLISLADELENNKAIQLLAVNGVFTAAAWAGVFWETGLMISYVTRVGKIAKRFPDDDQIKLQLARGLFNLTKEISQIGNQKVMQKIMEEIANLCENNPELISLFEYYSKSLVNAVYLFSEFTDSFDIVVYYLEKSKSLALENLENEEITLSYSKSLVNVIRMFGRFGKIEEMESHIENLRDFALTTDDREIVIRLGKAYVDAISAYGEMLEFDKISILYQELIEWSEEDPEDLAFQELLCKGLVNITSSYGKNQQFLDMSLYLGRLRQLADNYITLSKIQLQRIKGINLAIRWYLEANKFDEAYALFKEIEPIRMEFPDEIEIQEIYARTLRRILITANQNKNTMIVNQILDKIRDLFNHYTYNETIQIEFARSLSNLIIECVFLVILAINTDFVSFGIADKLNTR